MDLFYLLIVRGIKVSDGEDLNIYCGVLIVNIMDRLQIYLYYNFLKDTKYNTE